MVAIKRFIAVATVVMVVGCAATADTIGTHQPRRYGSYVGAPGAVLEFGRVQAGDVGRGVNAIGSLTTGPSSAGLNPPVTSSPLFNGSNNAFTSPSTFFLNDRMLLSPAVGMRTDEEVSLGSHASKETTSDTRSHDTAIITSVIPEPGSLALFGTGLVALAGLLRRKVNR